MAAKETVRYQVKCEKCKNEGIVVARENDHMYMKTVDLQVKGVEGNLDAEKASDSTFKVTCKACWHQWVM